MTTKKMDRCSGLFALWSDSDVDLASIPVHRWNIDVNSEMFSNTWTNRFHRKLFSSWNVFQFALFLAALYMRSGYRWKARLCEYDIGMMRRGGAKPQKCWQKNLICRAQISVPRKIRFRRHFTFARNINSFLIRSTSQLTNKLVGDVKQRSHSCK